MVIFTAHPSREFLLLNDTAFSQLLGRIRAESLELPGLELTAPQVQRLRGIDSATRDAAFASEV